MNVRTLLILLAIALLGAGIAFLGSPGEGADHRDSPLILGNPRLDINDLYVFRSPENPANVVLVLTVHPVVTPAVGDIFESAGRYDINISNDGDVDPDIVIRTRFTPGPQQDFVVEGLGSAIQGTVTGFGDALAVATAGDVRVFCGVRDDPFFFDLDAFQAFVAAPYVPTQGLRGPGLPGAPANFFGTLNTAAIVIELPIIQLTGGVDPNSGQIRVWTSSFNEI